MSRPPRPNPDFRAWPGTDKPRPGWMDPTLYRQFREVQFEGTIRARGFMYDTYGEWSRGTGAAVDVFETLLPTLPPDLRRLEADKQAAMRVNWRAIGVGAAADRHPYVNPGDPRDGKLRAAIRALGEMGRRIVDVLERMPLPLLRHLVFTSSFPGDRGKEGPYGLTAGDLRPGIAELVIGIDSLRRGARVGDVHADLASIRPAAARPDASVEGSRIQAKATSQPLRGVDNQGVYENETIMVARPKYRNINRIWSLRNVPASMFASAIMYATLVLFPGAVAMHLVVSESRRRRVQKWSDKKRFDTQVPELHLQPCIDLFMKCVDVIIKRLELRELVGGVRDALEDILRTNRTLAYVRPPISGDAGYRWLERPLGGVIISGERPTTLWGTWANASDDTAANGPAWTIDAVTIEQAIEETPRLEAMAVFLSDDYGRMQNGGVIKDGYLPSEDAGPSILMTALPYGCPLIGSQWINKINREKRKEMQTLLECAVSIRASYELLVRKYSNSERHPMTGSFFSTLREYARAAGGPRITERLAAITLAEMTPLISLSDALSRAHVPLTQTPRLVGLLEGMVRTGNEAIAPALRRMRQQAWSPYADVAAYIRTWPGRRALLQAAADPLSLDRALRLAVRTTSELAPGDEGADDDDDGADLEHEGFSESLVRVPSWPLIGRHANDVAQQRAYYTAYVRANRPSFGYTGIQPKYTKAERRARQPVFGDNHHDNGDKE